jgi:DNA-binding MarR family transcriptional regulator
MDSKLPASPMALYSECFALNLRRAARVISRRFDVALESVDLTNGQFATLCVIAGLQPVSMQMLAEHMSMDRTTLTAALKPLERRSLVSVRQRDVDRRVRDINLTREGMNLLREAIPLWKRIQRRIGREMGTASLPLFRAQLAQLSRAADVE